MESTIVVVEVSASRSRPRARSKAPALVDAFEKALQAATDKTEAADKDWYAAPLGELVDHIVEVHHGYMKTALPRLRSLVPTVLKAHGHTTAMCYAKCKNSSMPWMRKSAAI